MTSPTRRDGLYLDHDWYRSMTAQEFLYSVIDRGTQKRRLFGSLEKPNFPSQVKMDEFSYKIFLCGKSGVGKSCTVAKLVGLDIPKMHYDTPGIEMNIVYWPARVLSEDRLVMFRLEFWDAGDVAMRNFEHILPSMKEKSDAVIFVFSYVDKSSFDDLSSLMARILTAGDNLCQMVIGTKFDQHSKSEVTLRDIREFESVYRLPILRIKNIPVYHPSSTRSDVTETAPILNAICEYLWKRDVELSHPAQGEQIATYV